MLSICCLVIDMTHTLDDKPRGGRPWSFDRDKALHMAMTLFWRHGYEGVSLADLTKAIGVAPPSLYAAFGSKAGLYKSVLDRYEAGAGYLDVEITNSAGGLPDAVKLLLEAAVAIATRRENERGCMVSTGLITCHPDNDELARDLAMRREKSLQQLADVLARFACGEKTKRIARHVLSVMQGISIQARDGATVEELHEIVDEVVWGLKERFDA